MNTPSTVLPPELERIARKRVKARMGWYTHALIYACVIGGLALVGAWQGRYWPIAPALGWGVGLLMHGLSVFVWRAGSGFQDGMLQRERERLAQQQRPGT
ncbi:2TM domain-containing protein [Hydrogenophaga sp.]|uniref:2TM domain-containing protein n=1 Tax=Hydrogenophaga sp. TaxID=1904254 RepID=UPI0025BDC9A2|nr:2TM domain-containing protein [Hydrogenophaga sp.]